MSSHPHVAGRRHARPPLARAPTADPRARVPQNAEIRLENIDVCLWDDPHPLSAPPAASSGVSLAEASPRTTAQLRREDVPRSLGAARERRRLERRRLRVVAVVVRRRGSSVASPWRLAARARRRFSVFEHF